MENPVLIPTAVDGCGQGFLSLADRLKESSRFSNQLPAGLILDEFDRFKLWAGNIAAHRKGRRSLENRLRDAPQLKADTLGQLDFLSNTLKEALAIVKGERIPWDEQEFSDSDSDSDLSDIEESNSTIRSDTELKQLYGSIKTAVTSLMRISMAIREPAQSSQLRSIDKSHFEMLDMRHVQDKFPTAPSYLCKRLGLAITSRRQYLTYREEHHEKLAKGIDKLGLEAARSEFTTNSTEATDLQRTNSLKLTDDVEDNLSMTSYATSINATLRAPSLPKEAQQKEHYNCPYCYSLVNIHTTAAWKRHIYQDLHPYCCTFEDCATADRLYDSRHAWFAHELEAHHSTFQCVEGCSKVYKTEAEFESHVKSNHDDFLAPNLFSALKRTSFRTSSLNEMTACGLCNKTMTFRAMQKHLGHHQEQLALFALPPNLDDTEEDADGDDQDSCLIDKGSKRDRGEDLIDTSDASDSEEFDGNDDEDPQRIGEDKTTFCICNNGRSGSMIRCSSICEREWFHLRCVGASQEDSANYPAWYCPDCRKMRGTDAHGNPVSDVANIVVDNGPPEDAESSSDYEQLQQQSSPASDFTFHNLAEAGVSIDQVLSSSATGKCEAQSSDDVISERVQKDHTRVPLNDSNSNEAHSTRGPFEEARREFRKEVELHSGSERMFDAPPSAHGESISSTAQENQSTGEDQKPKEETINATYPVLEGHNKAASLEDMRKELMQNLTDSESWQKALKANEDWFVKERELLAKTARERVTKALAEWTKHMNVVEAAREAAENAPNKWPEEIENDVTEERNRIVPEYNRKELGREALDTNGLRRTMSQGLTVKSQVTEYDTAHVDDLEERKGEKQPVYRPKERVQIVEDLKNERDEEERTREARLVEGVDGRERASASNMAGAKISKKDIKEKRLTVEQWQQLVDSIAERAGESTREEEAEDASKENKARRFTSETQGKGKAAAPKNADFLDVEELAQITEGEIGSEEAMRKRLEQYGFEKHQIDAMIQPEEADKSASAEPESSSLRADHVPTYAKIHKDHLDIETLHYYDIPYEYDNVDSNFIIVLRDFDEKETDILFEHTRRLRSLRSSNSDR